MGSDQDDDSDPLGAPPSSTPAVVTPLRRMVVWDPATGLPVSTTEPMLTPPMIKDVIAASVSQPYEPDPLDPNDAKYAGHTNAEVMSLKFAKRAARSAEREDVDKLWDRLLGKPKWTGESVNVNVGYEDWLKEVERKSSPQPIDAEIVKPSAPDLFGEELFPR